MMGLRVSSSHTVGVRVECVGAVRILASGFGVKSLGLFGA